MRRLGDAEPAEVLGLPLEDIVDRLKLTGNGRKAFEMLERDFDPDEMVLRLAERGIRAVTFGDEDYPEKLREIPDPPPALFVKGEIPIGPMVALVGSRKASATGSEAARALGRALGERGVCVTSDLALGIMRRRIREPLLLAGRRWGAGMRYRRGISEEQPTSLQERRGGRQYRL